MFTQESVTRRGSCHYAKLDHVDFCGQFTWGERERETSVHKLPF